MIKARYLLVEFVGIIDRRDSVESELRMRDELVKLGTQLSKLVEVFLYLVVVSIDRGFLSLLLKIPNAFSDLSQDGSGLLDRLARQPILDCAINTYNYH